MKRLWGIIVLVALTMSLGISQKTYAGEIGDALEISEERVSEENGYIKERDETYLKEESYTGFSQKRSSQVLAESQMNSGNCGEDLEWSYDPASQTLTISGQGPMEDYGDTSAPWESLVDELKTVIIEEGVTYIGEAAFWQMNNINTVELPSTLTEIGVASFGQCYDLTEITFNDNLQKIGRYAFQDDNLDSIELPVSLASLDPISFLRVYATEVSVAEGNKYFTEIDNVVFNQDVTELYYCPAGLTGDYKIPSTVTTVKEYAFSYGLYESIVIPEGVVTIEDGAFCNCSIVSIDIPDSVTYIGDFMCEQCEDMVSLSIGNGLSELNYRAFAYCEQLEQIEFGENLESIASLAFAYCTALEEISLPDSVVNIENGAFGECTSLKSVQLPSGLKEIWDQGFFRCSSLEQIDFPETLEKIYDEAFYDTALSYVVIPNSVTYIGPEAFPEGAELVLSDKLQQLEDGSYTLVAIVDISSQEYYSEAFEVLRLVNEERKKAGCEPLTMDVDLLKTAMLRSSELGILFSHTRPTGQDCSTASSKMYGENIAVGHGSASSVMDDWMNSDGHRSNILSSDYESIGIGVAKINGRLYWTQCFGFDEARKASEDEYTDGSATREIFFNPEFEELNYGIAVETDTLQVGEISGLDFYFDNSFDWIFVKPEYLKYESSNKRVCTVTDGAINAVGSGKADITVSLPKSPEIAFTKTITVTGEGGIIEEPENPFVDVKESDYYYDAVLWAYENEITLGTDETHFQPEKVCSRAQVVTVLWRTKGEPQSSISENPFVDVKETDYYYDAVLWAYENGITLGVDETHFDPNRTIQRGQFVTFLWRAEGEVQTHIENPFVDVKETDYYYDAVLWAYENEITSGTDENHFNPQDGCTRGQVVTFLYRTYN